MTASITKNSTPSYTVRTRVHSRLRLGFPNADPTPHEAHENMLHKMKRRGRQAGCSHWAGISPHTETAPRLPRARAGAHHTLAAPSCLRRAMCEQTWAANNLPGTATTAGLGRLSRPVPRQARGRPCFHGRRWSLVALRTGRGRTCISLPSTASPPPRSCLKCYNTPLQPHKQQSNHTSCRA